jgi:hypothetical protein
LIFWTGYCGSDKFLRDKGQTARAVFKSMFFKWMMFWARCIRILVTGEQEKLRFADGEILLSVDDDTIHADLAWWVRVEPVQGMHVRNYRKIDNINLRYIYVCLLGEVY